LNLDATYFINRELTGVRSIEILEILDQHRHDNLSHRDDLHGDASGNSDFSNFPPQL
jgi:hypothetical protein